MSTNRKRYSKEFKAEAFQLWENSGKTAAQIEADLGLPQELLYQWKSALKKKKAAEVDSSAAEAAEIRRLKKELAIAREERDILKKAISIFSPKKH